ncbi:MAG: histidine phosphatase family protein [Clostridium sp.]|uniref:histidine phosphatase family protein n=1 Tax=Clostridium sp. TaxID=1506 RepID=UPI003F354C8E
MKKVLYLIRHGKTKYNEEKRYLGHTDIELSFNGKREIEEKTLNLKDVEKYFTTGMKRTNETFNILFKEKRFEVIEELKEYNFGVFEGKTYEELKEDKEYIAWITDTTKSFKIPKGESKDEFYKRIEKGLKKALENINESGVIVCHGGVIGTLLELFSDSDDYFYNLQPKCGGGYKIIVENIDPLRLKIEEEF